MLHELSLHNLIKVNQKNTSPVSGSASVSHSVDHLEEDHVAKALSFKDFRASQFSGKPLIASASY